MNELTGTVKERSDIAESYKWDLTHLYEDDNAWQRAKTTAKARFKEIENFRGNLGKSADELLGCLTFIDEVYKELIRLSGYASMHSDQDTREEKYLAMKQEMSGIYTEFASLSSFIEPEILAVEEETLKQFIRENEGLEIYRFYLDDLNRKKAHRGSEGEERIMAEASAATGVAYQTFNIFTNADFPYPEETLSDGRKITLNQSNFALHRTSSNIDDRKKVFESFFGALKKFQRTFGVQLYGALKKDLFYKKARRYNSCLEAALDAHNIPTTIYHNLIAQVNQNLDTFHRYLNLRKRLMELDGLNYYDLYAPLVKDVDLKYSYEDARRMIVESLAPVGNEYVSVIDQAFNERWIDVYPTAGKRSGAYSNGSAYDVHPYILLNYNGQYNDVGTLTHELGHTMHSYLSNRRQPFALSHYPIFVAEVASTFNEALLSDYMLNKIDDENVRLSLLGAYLEGAKGTLFRQTQFAEFELKIHEMTEAGEALTGDSFSQLYLDITRKYYGHDEKVCQVNDLVGIEWAYVPHFYYNFYVFQYATSFTASQALAAKMLSGEAGMKQKYLDFLSSGGSKYPVDLLKDAGVDMNGTEPFDLTIGKLNHVMNEIEAILDKK